MGFPSLSKRFDSHRLQHLRPSNLQRLLGFLLPDNLRVTVGMIVGVLASGKTTHDVLQSFPYLEEEDIKQALAYAAWRSQEHDVSIAAPR